MGNFTGVDFTVVYDAIPIQNDLIKAALIIAVCTFGSYFIWSRIKRFLHNLATGTSTDIDDRIVQRMDMPVTLLIVVIGIYVTGGILDAPSYFGDIYHKVFFSVIAFLVVFLFYRMIKLFLEASKQRLKSDGRVEFDKKVYPLLEISIQMVLMLAYLLVFFSIWNIDLSPLLASAGIAGVALAFAAKDTVANIFGGVSLFLDKTFKIGDYIIIDNQDRGEVVDISLRSTKLRTRDDEIISVPNSILSNSKVINETGIDPRLRVRIDVNVAYDADLEQVQKVLERVAKEADFVEKHPAPRARFRGFQEYSIGVQLLFWINEPVNKGLYSHKMIKKIYSTFREEGIGFPYPVRDVRMPNHNINNAG